MKIYEKQKEPKDKIIEVIITALINTSVLLLATSVFKGFYISGFKYAFIAALLIMVLNMTVKPVLKLLTLPITIMSVGLFYPFINVMILKLTSFFMGNNFVLDGWIVPFFISIFISVMNIILDVVITKQIIGNK